MRYDDDERPRDVLWFLVEFNRRAFHEVSGKSGHPTRTLFARVVLVTLVLACGGGILWDALWAMPTALAVFIGSVIVFRVVRWYWRRDR
jgi:hypothetical protein